MSQPPSTFLKTAAISNLAQLRKGDSATVIGLADDEGSAATFMKNRLQELGFTPGERIHVHAEAFPCKDPMAIRVGNSIFALRRREAARIYIAQNDNESD
ncbi:FeoA family protein [Oxalobacter paraformigenes]|uniref:Ferrous iron transporter FeoA-like domain-containing protein n=1 Tax=Oxalobacter paraformigenes TaxID=556268 RepID=T5LTF0_9BURK|nr:FeoA family protein [Oxalobacter paraformigenes]EQM95324.1 hypothetical protein OFAG_02377 [Oxalobacter paraformigenes]